MDLEFWRGKRVLVTGGAGFVGRWVGRALQRADSELHILDLAPPINYEVPFSFYHTDLRDLNGTVDLLEKVRPSVIIHLAGQPGVQSSHDNPVGAYEANILCTFNILEASRRQSDIESLVAVSSNHVYGEQLHTPTPENAALNGAGMYAVSKLCGDVLARTYGKTYKNPVGVARMTNSYGGDDHHVTHIITGTILSCLRGETPVIKQSGRDRKGYLYVKDTAAGLLAVASSVARNPELRGEAFNLVPNESISVLDLVRTIIRCSGKDVEPKVLNPGAPCEEEHLENVKAQRLLGWQSQFSLAAGIEETIEWYRARI